MISVESLFADGEVDDDADVNDVGDEEEGDRG